ncbi:hypothetical protein X737_35560 [Mesorhizobium sp. L48C026A00]|nr:hypothetical protein X737_35560 [Mesorhizobium sp. L48C026A00]
MAVITIDIAERLADAHGLSKTQAKTVVEDVLKGIGEAAAKGEEISLNGFGKFKPLIASVSSVSPPAH